MWCLKRDFHNSGSQEETFFPKKKFVQLILRNGAETGLLHTVLEKVLSQENSQLAVETQLLWCIFSKCKWINTDCCLISCDSSRGDKSTLQKVLHSQ